MADPVFDNASGTASLASNSASFTFVVGSGTNRVMGVFVRTSSDSDLVTAVTVNSVVPFQTVKAIGNGAPYHSLYLYMFLAPASGLATVSVTTSSNTDIYIAAMSFANCFQGNYDSTTGTLLASGTTLTVTTTSVADRALPGMFVWNSNEVPSAAAVVTREVSFVNGSTVSGFSGTAVITPPGSVFPSATTVAATAWGGFTFTLAPPAPVVPVLKTSTIADRVVRTKPPTPNLGVAGYTFNDPTFGSWIMRVTDGNTTSTDPGNPATGESFNLNSNTTQHGWSADSKKFYIQRTDGNFFIVPFDPVALKLATPVWLSGLSLDVTFDGINSNLMYGNLSSAPNHHTVGQADITNLSSIVFSTLFDCATIVGASYPSGDTYTSTIMCAQGNLAVLCGGAAQDQHFFVIWYPIANPGNAQVLNTMTRSGMGFHIHALQIDQTGRYIVMGPAAADNAPYKNYIWDTTLNTITPITVTDGGHGDLGANGEAINQDVFSGSYDGFQYVFRYLSSPDSTARNVVNPLLSPQEVYVADHSCCNDAKVGVPLVFTSSTYRYNDANSVAPYNYTSSPQNTTAWRACDGEIIQVNTNLALLSTTPIRRICHNRSLVDQMPQSDTSAFFLNQPLLNISPNGLWCLFHSNWDMTLGTDTRDSRFRHDVFLVFMGAPLLPCNPIEGFLA